eukprot:COSAG05_NODE_10427_length_566_cov_0.873662_1_plen_165_part_00
MYTRGLPKSQGACADQVRNRLHLEPVLRGAALGPHPHHRQVPTLEGISHCSSDSLKMRDLTGILPAFKPNGKCVAEDTYPSRYCCDTIGMSENLEGVTILAWGAQVPDMLASVAMAKKGFGPGAVANAVGSQIINVWRRRICTSVLGLLVVVDLQRPELVLNSV